MVVIDFEVNFSETACINVNLLISLLEYIVIFGCRCIYLTFFSFFKFRILVQFINFSTSVIVVLNNNWKFIFYSHGHMVFITLPVIMKI